MTADKMNEIRQRVKNKRPLIHCITNPISINQCANTVLAVGGRPVMAEHPEEVSEITAASQALMLNLGNITDVRMKAMLISAETAKENNIPVVIDIVGAACSELRRSFIREFLRKYTPEIIKGNYSEICALNNDGYKASGVDADTSLDIDDISKTAVLLARCYNTVILASGKIDIVTDGKRIIYISNGSHQLADITGTGCMQGALCGCYLAYCNAESAAVTACAVLGICGSLAETAQGNGTFFLKLMDNLSTLTDLQLKNHLQTEVKEIEKI